MSDTPQVSSAASKPNVTVLIVDDQDEVRKLLRMILEHEGYEFLEAHDGASAINQIQKFRPELGLTGFLCQVH